MSNFDEESEDGELARSPIHRDEMEFSLSDDDRDLADSLDIKPPQAVVKKKSLKHKDRHRQKSHREHKHSHRDRDSHIEKISKEHRDSHREKDIFFKDREAYRKFREPEKVYTGELYRDNFGVRDKYKERELQRNRAIQKEKDREAAMRERDAAMRERDAALRDRDAAMKEREANATERVRTSYNPEREAYSAKSRSDKYADSRKVEARLRALAEGDGSLNQYEKENKSKFIDPDKELEDLRSRLLSKRRNKETKEDNNKTIENHSDRSRSSASDRAQEERRKKLLEAEKEMEKRKQASRTELEERRERRRGQKRPDKPEENQEEAKKMKKSEAAEEEAVLISDASDEEMQENSEHESEPEEGEHSNSESESSNSSDSTNSDTESESSRSEKEQDEEKEEKTSMKSNGDVQEAVKEGSSTRSPLDKRATPQSANSKDRSRTRSRSHSFSPPPPGSKESLEEANRSENGTTKEQTELLNSLPPYYPALQGCRSVEEFTCLNRIEEGTYGVVYRARDKTTEEIVALKRLKMEKEKEGFPITSLREINTLLKGQHPNIVTVREIVVGSNMDKIFIVMDYVEHDLKSLMETMRNKKQVFLPGEVKCLMLQLLRAVHHLHNNWILHRDLKTSNLLLSHKGILKVGDFGLAREYGSPLRAYTPIVVTLWYRSPELLLCCKEYSTAIDMWSVGCIFAEFVTMNPLFPGKSEVDQLNKIFKDLGTPNETIWSGYKQLPAVQKMTFADFPPGGLRQRINSDLLSELGLTLLNGFLTYDPTRRIAADAALEHAYFKETPVAIDPAMFPTWPAKSEGGRRATHSPRPPAGGTQQLSEDSPGFHISNSHQQQRSINVTQGFSLKF